MFNIRRTVAAALFALAIKFVPTAAAQAPVDSTARDAIDLRTARFVSVADTVRAPAMNSRRVWDVQGGGTGHHTARGAIIGGAVGGVLGAVAGAGLASGLCDAADCSGTAVSGALVGGALVGLAGAAIGALIGFVW
jgi:hypothetical protein